MSKIKVVPCSGIGKVYGLMAREAALTVTDRLCPDIAETACLAHLVSGEDEAVAKVKGLSCLTVDGCSALCAAKSVEAAGGIVEQQYRMVDAMRLHKGKNPGSGTTLSSDGLQIVDEFAAKIAQHVAALQNVALDSIEPAKTNQGKEGFKMALTEKEKELVAIGASIGGNCIPCLDWHYKKCIGLGFSKEEMQDAFDMAKMVKEVPNKKIYEKADNLIGGKQAGQGPPNDTADCGCGASSKSTCC